MKEETLKKIIETQEMEIDKLTAQNKELKDLIAEMEKPEPTPQPQPSPTKAEEKW